MPLKASDVEVYNSLERRAARLLAKGILSHNQVAAALGCSRQAVDKWSKDPKFIALMREYAKDEEQSLMDLMQDGMNHAVLALIEACHASDSKGRPLFAVRMKAAAALLDRNGRPGPIPEVTESRTETKTLTASMDNPLVRRLLAEQESVPLLEYKDFDAGTGNSAGEQPDGVPDLREQPVSVLSGDTRSEAVGETTIGP